MVGEEHPEGVIVQFGGQTPLKLARRSRRRACRCSARRSTRSTWPRTAGRFGALLRRLEIAHPPYGTALSADEAVADRRGRRLPAAGPPLLRARRAGDGDLLLDRGPRRLPRGRTSRPTRSIRCCSTASSRTRSRSTSTRSPTARTCCVAGIMQHVEEAGVHSGDSACVIPPMSLGEEMLEEIRGDDRADRARARGDRADQHPVRGRRRRALRDRGQPARLAHGALRLQGDRRAAGEDRLPADARRARSPTRSCPSGPPTTSASRRRCCPSPASPAPTRCSGRR